MSTKKRITKAQRDAAQKAALLQRVSDIYAGALGQAWDDDEFATAEILSRVMPALESVFNNADVRSMFLLAYFDNPRSAAERLYAMGIRA